MKAEHYPYDIALTGYGHHSYMIDYRGKAIKTITDNSHAIDDMNSEEGERDGRELRRLRGAKALRSEAIMKRRRQW